MAYGFDFHKFDINKFDEQTTEFNAQDELALSDAYHRIIQKVISEGLSLSDRLVGFVYDAMQEDVLNLIETFTKSSDKTDAEIEVVVDDIASKAIKQFNDIETIEDVFNNTFEKMSNNGVSLSESICIQIRKEFESTAIELIEASDLPEFTLEKKESQIEEIADELVKIIVKSLPTDSETLDDDSFRVIKPHHIEIHPTTEDISFDVEANRNTLQNVIDKYNAEIVDYTAIVYVGGYKIRVQEGLTISDSSNDRVSSCSFVLPNVQDWMLDILRIRAEVHVMLFDGNTTEHFGGRIVANPVSWRGYAPMMSIEAEDYTATADDYIVIQSYRDKFVHEIVQEMWTEFYDDDIEFDIQTTTLKIPEIKFNYETLFNAMETLVEQIGWTWFIDWDGSKKTLRFFSPETNVFPQRLGWGEKNVLEQGFEFGQDYEMFNALYFFGGEAESLPISEKDVADGEQYIFTFAYEPTDITILVDGVQQKIGIENIHNFDDDDVDCLVNYQEKALRFPENNPPPKDAVVEKVYRYRYTIVTYIEDAVSIDRYGKIVKEIHENNIADIQLANDRARQLLHQHSSPQVYGKMDVRNVHGIRAGHVVEIYLPNIGVEGFFEVMEVQKVALAKRIKVSISVNKIENPETEIAQKLKDFAKRIRELEKSEIDENTVVHRFRQGFENLLVSENVDIASRTAGVTFFDDARFNHADFA